MGGGPQDGGGGGAEGGGGPSYGLYVAGASPSANYGNGNTLGYLGGGGGGDGGYGPGVANDGKPGSNCAGGDKNF